MTALDYISLALGGGAALGAVIYALYTNHSLSSTIASQAALIIGLGSKLSDSDRNALQSQQQRDTAVARADKAEAENADLRAQLTSTQAALIAAEKANTENASASVLNAASPLDALNSVLASEARPNVPAAGDASAGNGDQSKPAV